MCSPALRDAANAHGRISNEKKYAQTQRQPKREEEKRATRIMKNYILTGKPHGLDFTRKK